MILAQTGGKSNRLFTIISPPVRRIGYSSWLNRCLLKSCSEFRSNCLLDIIFHYEYNVYLNGYYDSELCILEVQEGTGRYKGVYDG